MEFENIGPSAVERLGPKGECGEAGGEERQAFHGKTDANGKRKAGEAERGVRPFGNVRQKRGGFAEHWQIHRPHAKNFLPMFGKMRVFLPNIGKTLLGVEAAPGEAESPQATGRTTLGKRVETAGPGGVFSSVL
ncbi:MAG: hypothetical protein IJS32_09315 [Kiritimatiellae bacterium]|nr:hypothetical protein [Kiritimatiellia bacterium]